LGATLSDRRIEIPELELKQRENALSLTGEMEVPSKDRPWWEKEFAFDVEAAVGSLGELARLGGESFSDFAGRVDLSGSVRNKGGLLGGQVIAKGSGIGWRDVPFDSFDAALKLNGNEIQVLNLSLVRGDDALRARGLFNIRGENGYWGEIQASVGDLGHYRALLAKPLFERPPVGRIRLDWSGDGSRKYHSGAFKASVVALAGEAGRWHVNPLDGEFEGTYSPGHLALTKCKATVGDMGLSAGVVVGPGTVEVRDLKVDDAKKGCLTGGVTLPIDCSKGFAATAWTPSGAISGKLEAKRFRIESLKSLLVGFPDFKGELTGAVEVSGSGEKPVASGAISARELKIAPFKASDVQFDVLGRAVAVSGWPFRLAVWPGLVGGGVLSGRVDWSNRPLAVHASGEISSVEQEGKTPVAALLGEALWPDPAVTICGGIERLGDLDLTAWTGKTVMPKGGAAKLDLNLAIKGSKGFHSVAGSVSATGVPVETAKGDLSVTEGSVYWPGNGVRQPIMNIRAKGTVSGSSVEVYRAGDAVGGVAAIISEPPMDEAVLRRLLLEGVAEPGAAASVELGAGR
jgi:hypothetical protein